jgi:hypothetical protein
MLLSCIRRVGVQRLKLSKKIFIKMGLFPIRDHYFEPLFNPNHLRKSLRENRALPGIDLNVKEQLEILERFNYNEELVKFPLQKTKEVEFYYHNGSFESGDAEYLYCIIRLFKPNRIVEIGSGNSTLMAINAVVQNRRECSSYSCEHICIEPYEMPWLEKVGPKVVRERVETTNKRLFYDLCSNDVLFIDSSHIIKPQGDVLSEYLEILPILKSGVLVHIHDIFTPKDYLDEWILEEVRFWNEQYLLEAFMTFNSEYKVIGALNYLKHNYFAELSRKCPILRNEADREPGSFWIMRK